MIRWMDFVLDDVCGPVLLEESSRTVSLEITVCRKNGMASASVMEDAKLGNIQETGQEQRPARMVGLSGLDSKAETGMEAGSARQNPVLRQRGEA